MEFINLQPLIWLTVIAVFAMGLWFSLVDQPPWRRFLSFAFRVAAVVLLILALCRPYWSDESEQLHVVFLVDVSESVDLDSAIAITTKIEESIGNLDDDDSWSLYAVGKGVRAFSDPGKLMETLNRWQSGVPDAQFRSASRLADSLLETRLDFPAGKSRRVVLYSDGQETDTDIAAAIQQMRDEQVDVRLNRISGLSRPEAAVVSLRPSTTNAFQGEVVRMSVDLASNAPISGKLRIIHKGVAVLERQVAIAPDKPNVTRVDVNMTTPGASTWTAELIPEDDHFPINNQSSCTVTVRGKPNVLVLHERPVEMRPLTRAMKQQDIELDVRGNFGLPDSINELLAFDAIVIANLPATLLTPQQMELLKRYVVDFGGGLVMLGSENSFGLGGYYKTPVEEVLPLVSRFEKEKEKPSLAMVLVIDKSGSMEGTPIALARQAAKAAVELLGPRDMIGVLGFDGQPYIVSEMRSAAESNAVNAAIDSLAAGGGTYMYPALVSGKEMLENASAKIRHMIVLSDGQTQPADHEGLAQAMADSGITVSTVALGEADRQLMARIADIGRGRYYETNDPTNVPQIFTKETMQASRSAIKEDLYGTVITSDHPILSGYSEDDLPFTLGYIMTESKPTAQLLLVAETGDPLLAVSRYGLGAGMAYTSDLSERWGAEWLAWSKFGSFWAQALRGVLRKANAQGLEINDQQSLGIWSLDIKRLTSGGVPIGDIHWDASSMDESGQMNEVTVRQVGLGRYRAEVSLAEHKSLTLRLRDQDHDKLKVLHYHRPYPAEYRLSSKLPPALSNLTSIEPASIRADITPIRRRKPVSHYFYLAAFACLWAGILLRRV